MITLTDLQSRVIGVMLEKEITTPEQYPLSLNALTNGCNQKSNREPVLSLSEPEVQNVLDELIDLKQVMVDTGASGRVNKYKHRFCNTSFGHFQFTDQQKSIICVLLLRGAQTPGELRTRTHRLAKFNNVDEVEEVLTQLQHLNNHELVKKLEREAGKRESRYIHLFSDSVNMDVIKVDVQTESLIDQDDLEYRVKLLEQEVNDLKSELANFSALMNK